MNARHRVRHGSPSRITSKTADSGQRKFRKGQIVFNSRCDGIRSFMVTSGEVIIVRDGSMVDIVEEGEALDPCIWNHAIGVAWTDCRLVGVG